MPSTLPIWPSVDKWIVLQLSAKKLRSTVQCKFFSLYGYSYEMLWVGSPVYSGIDGRMERIGALPVATFTITWVLV